MPAGKARPLRIGINALYLIPGKVGGTEIYLRNALQALAAVDAENQYFVFRNRETGSDLIPSATNFHDRAQPVRGASRPARIVYEQCALPFLSERLQLDVLFNAGFTAPLLCLCPMVTVFHDLQYKRHPEFFRWFDLPFWRMLLPASARRSRRLVALSQTVKSDLMQFYAIPEERIAVIPHGVEQEFTRIRERRCAATVDSNLILSVSTLHPHKNLDRLLTAFQLFHARHNQSKLWLVGLKGFESEKIEARRRALGLGDAVTITGWIPRAELYALFASAGAFVYPSRFEGFGIPVLEALAAGIPTACSELPSLKEIAGDAVRYFDPDSVADMVNALEAVTGDEELRARLGEAGPQRAADFSWAQAGWGLLRVFREAVQPAIRRKNSQDF